jgi:hypothetical protein
MAYGGNIIGLFALSSAICCHLISKSHFRVAKSWIAKKWFWARFSGNLPALIGLLSHALLSRKGKHKTSPVICNVFEEGLTQADSGAGYQPVLALVKHELLLLHEELQVVMQISSALGPITHSGEDQDLGGLLAEIGGESFLELFHGK